MATPVQDNGSGRSVPATPTAAAAAPGPPAPMSSSNIAGNPTANSGSGLASAAVQAPSAPTATTPTPTTSMMEGQQAKTVKRPRPVKSCNSCRQRKLRCDRTCPCSQCLKSNRPCKYANDDGIGGNASYSDGGSDVEASSPRPAKRVHRVVLPPQAQYLPDTVLPSHAHVQNGQEHRSASASSSLLDAFGSRLERLERLMLSKGSPGAAEWGPSSRAQADAGFTSVAGSPGKIRGLSVKGNLRTRLFGQNSTRVLLNLFDEARDFILNSSNNENLGELFVQMQRIYRAMQEEHRKALSPITVFIDSMVPVQKRMADILPKKLSCDRLIEAYIGASEGLYRIIHIPSFRAEYDQFWQTNRPSDGFLPRLLCMLSIGARFETDSRGLSHDRTDGVHLPTACALVRTYLDSLRGKQLVDINTLQSEVLLLHAQRMVSTRQQESWTQLGLIVRMAMTMGLHRDPSEFPQIRPFFAETRRRLWYTIADMDLHVALACNLPCAIRDGEYTCRPPSNLDDDDIHPDMTRLPEPKPIDQYTNTQLQAYAARTLPYRIRVSAIINRLDSLRDFQEVLDCGAQLERILDDIHCLFPRNQALDPRGKFKEWRMRALLDMHVRRPLLALYRPFALSTVDCPAHISTSYLKSSMTMLTYMDELDPRMPGFADVSHMYNVVLKHDIMQAAFSVCYYIKSARESQAGLNGHLGSPEGIEMPFVNALDPRTIWSTLGMTKTVEKTLDALIGLLKDSSCDMKDVVVLSVVLNSVKAVPGDQRLETIKGGVVRVIDACLQALNTSSEVMSSMTVRFPIVTLVCLVLMLSRFSLGRRICFPTSRSRRMIYQWEA